MPVSLQASVCQLCGFVNSRATWFPPLLPPPPSLSLYFILPSFFSFFPPSLYLSLSLPLISCLAISYFWHFLSFDSWIVSYIWCIFSFKPVSTDIWPQFKCLFVGIFSMVFVMSWGDCCCSAAQLCQTLCNPMDCSTSGFPVLHHFPEFAQTHIRWVSDAVQSSRPL